MKLSIVCITIFLFVAAISAVHAEAAGSVSPQELVSFVDSAAAYAQENGKDKAIAEFNNKEGQFVKGQLYIFADDFSGINLAHPMRPDFVGKSQFDLKDKNGVAFIQNMIAIAKTGGSGLTYYIFANPADGNKEELKLVYVKKIDDAWWIGSGIYLPGVA
ncbi:MAG TPA: cache domain-containing protein [Methanotrichaceae archaeon]|nr:cache domain-containing protein [Methanotrichaceae archaeon]